jgi:hypothetical protein
MDVSAADSEEGLAIFFVAAYAGIFFYGLVYRIASGWYPSTPTYPCSMVHATSCVFAVAALTPESPVGIFKPGNLATTTNTAAAILGQSAGYFIIDSLFEPQKMWIVHHMIAVAAEFGNVGSGNFTVAGSVLLGFAELGSLLHNISYRHRRSHAIRVLFLLVYGASRICMFIIIAGGCFEVPDVLRGVGCIWDGVRGGLLLVAWAAGAGAVWMNAWFLLKQVRAYRRHFWEGGVETYTTVAVGEDCRPQRGNDIGMKVHLAVELETLCTINA